MANREIKFRVWIPKKSGGEMEEYPEMTEWDVADNIDFMQQLGKGGIILQYTGLKDKNGKEIYEGDIVNGASFGGSYAYGKVIYFKDGFVIEPIGRFIEGLADLYDSVQYKIEIIGNIYETPQLLK